VVELVDTQDLKSCGQ